MNSLLPQPVALDSGSVYIITITTGTDKNYMYTVQTSPWQLLMMELSYIRSTYSTVPGGHTIELKCKFLFQGCGICTGRCYK